MELVHDSRIFQKFFGPALNADVLTSGSLLVNESQLLELAPFHEEFSAWKGALPSQVIGHFRSKTWAVYEKKDLEEGINQCWDLPHFFDQIQSLKALNKKAPLKKSSLQFRHFFFKILNRLPLFLLPSKFGILICLDENPQECILLQFHFGKLSCYQKPYFSKALPKTPLNMVHLLQEEKGVPIQGLFLASDEWLRWSLRPPSNRELKTQLLSQSKVSQALVPSNTFRRMLLRWALSLGY